MTWYDIMMWYDTISWYDIMWLYDNHGLERRMEDKKCWCFKESMDDEKRIMGGGFHG